MNGKKKKSIVGEGVRDVEDLVVTWDILKKILNLKNIATCGTCD